MFCANNSSTTCLKNLIYLWMKWRGNGTFFRYVVEEFFAQNNILHRLKITCKNIFPLFSIIVYAYYVLSIQVFLVCSVFFSFSLQITFVYCCLYCFWPKFDPRNLLPLYPADKKNFPKHYLTGIVSQKKRQTFSEYYSLRQNLPEKSKISQTCSPSFIV